MPQLLPFYFVNQITWTIISLFLLTWMISIYILPYLNHLFVTRVYITKI